MIEFGEQPETSPVKIQRSVFRKRERVGRERRISQR